MHSHSHGHSHGNTTEADWLTNLGAVGEAIEGAANLFFGATVYNTLYELSTGTENQDRLGWPLYIGITLGIISLGSAYTHRLLDTAHQRVRSLPEENDHQYHRVTGYANEDEHADHEGTPDLEAHIESKPTEPLHPQDDSAHENRERKAIPAKLNGWQKLSLFSDATSHVFGRAGLLTGIVDGITDTVAQTTLPPTTKALIQLGAVAFGGLTSASGIRTCWNTMLEKNQQEIKPDPTKLTCSHR
jgi:hypothetical protein